MFIEGFGWQLAMVLVIMVSIVGVGIMIIKFVQRPKLNDRFVVIDAIHVDGDKKNLILICETISKIKQGEKQFKEEVDFAKKCGYQPAKYGCLDKALKRTTVATNSTFVCEWLGERGILTLGGNDIVKSTKEAHLYFAFQKITV